MAVVPPDASISIPIAVDVVRTPAEDLFDRRVFDPMKKALTSQAMDPAIDL